jgi:hypothetical protein
VINFLTKAAARTFLPVLLLLILVTAQASPNVFAATTCPANQVANASGKCVATTSCTNNAFFGFPTWYSYLPGQVVNGSCSPEITKLTDIWLIAAAVIEILLRIAAIVAVVFVIYGAAQYMTSQGEPETTAKARVTITSALIGLAIAISSAAVVAYIAGSFN